MLKTSKPSPLFFLVCGLAFLASIHAQHDTPTLGQTRAQYYAGQYEEALQAASKGRENSPWDKDWWQLEGEILTTIGEYEKAFSLLKEGVDRQPYDLRLRLSLRKAALFADEMEFAERQDREISSIISSSNRYRIQADTLVAIGEAALTMGIEPRLILENFFKKAQRETNPPASAFLAMGRLALDKGDYKLASKTYQEGLQIFPENPDLWFGLASSFLNGDRTQMAANADKALAINKHHLPTLLLLADHLIDAEAYDEAQLNLDKILHVNDRHPQAHALKAAIAFIQEDEEQGDAHRERALSTWSRNPEVDYLIGKKLSQKYRFLEGSAFQREALLSDRDFSPARIQLAQDLLRLDRDTEGWELASEAHEEDPYDITAYNLVSLHDKLDEFVTLETDRFRIKMAAKEAPIYGERALKLLEDAYQSLSSKYGIELDHRVTVEIYDNPSDFQVRTFGMPGNPGFLGVCFGPVFTMNSPASQRANWESVMYHEFCHVITLSITRNRMPRWLSEGISVYEEKLHDSSWGQMMTVDYRERILEDRMKHIGEMSAAFMRARDDKDIQFAYFQSALVTRFLVESYGLEAMKAVLYDLGDGVSMNDALAQHFAPLKTLNSNFVVFAKAEAKKMGGNFAFKKNEGMLDQILQSVNPKSNYFDELEAAKGLMDEENWEQAKESLEALTIKAGYIPGDANAHIYLATCYRELEQTELEKLALTQIAENEGSALRPVARLLEIANKEEDWEAARRWSHRWLAINPMATTPWQILFDAEEVLENSKEAINVGETLLALDPPNLASIHYRVARQYQDSNSEQARKHTLMALEEAPRFREAYQLLTDLQKQESIPEPAKPLLDLEVMIQ